MHVYYFVIDVFFSGYVVEYIPHPHYSVTFWPCCVSISRHVHFYYLQEIYTYACMNVRFLFPLLVYKLLKFLDSNF